MFQETRLETTSGADLEHNKNVGQIPTVMRVLTSKEGDLSSHFDESDETQDGVNNSSLKHKIINSHTEVKRKKKANHHYNIYLVFVQLKRLFET